MFKKNKEKHPLLFLELKQKP